MPHVTSFFSGLGAWFSSIWPWVEAHPVFASVIFWPIITAIVTWFLKPRSPEEYAALAANHPRIAQVLRLVGALGLDLPKVLQILGDLVKRVPKGPVVIFLLVGLSFGSSGCALFTKGNAKSVLDLAQTLCIVAHQTLPDSDVAKVCGLSEPFFDPMRELLSSSRQASAKAAAEASAKAGAAKCVAPSP